MLQQRLKECRNKIGLSQQDIADKLYVTQQAYAKWETGKATPNPDALSELAKIFGVTSDYLLGNSNEPTFTRKDEQDIKQTLDKILNDMDSKSSMMFDGEEIEMDDESKEFLRSSIENSLRVAKMIAKEKYTPKKYKK